MTKEEEMSMILWRNVFTRSIISAATVCDEKNFKRMGEMFPKDRPVCGFDVFHIAEDN